MRCPTGFWSIHSNHKVRGGVGFERKRPHKSTSVNWVQYLVFHWKKRKSFTSGASVTRFKVLPGK